VNECLQTIKGYLSASCPKAFIDDIDEKEEAIRKAQEEAESARKEKLILKYKQFLQSRKWDARTTDLKAELKSNTKKLYDELKYEIRQDRNGIRYDSRLGVHTLDDEDHGELLIHVKDNLYVNLDKDNAYGLVEIDLEDLDDPVKYVGYSKDGTDQDLEDSVRDYLRKQYEGFDEECVVRATTHKKKVLAETKLDDDVGYDTVKKLWRCEGHLGHTVITGNVDEKWDAFQKKHSKEAEDILRNTSGATLFYIHQMLEHSNGVVHLKNVHTQCAYCKNQREYYASGYECKCGENATHQYYEEAGVPNLPEPEEE